MKTVPVAVFEPLVDQVKVRRLPWMPAVSSFFYHMRPVRWSLIQPPPLSTSERRMPAVVSPDAP